MKIKDFSIFEEEVSVDNGEPKSEPRRGVPEAEPKTKDMKLGELKDGTKVMSKMKVGHTLVLDYHEFWKLRKMKTSHYERDMLKHSRGGREYRIAKEKDSTFTIFHYNKTLHELTPIAVFALPERRNSDKKLKESVEFGFFNNADHSQNEVLKRVQKYFPTAMFGGKEYDGKILIAGNSDYTLEETVNLLEKIGVKKEDVYTWS